MSASDTQIGGEHYKKLPIQPARFSEANGLSFLEACVVKRICRYREKGGYEDLLKLCHEVALLAEYRYGRRIYVGHDQSVWERKEQKL